MLAHVVRATGISEHVGRHGGAGVFGRVHPRQLGCLVHGQKARIKLWPRVAKLACAFRVFGPSRIRPFEKYSARRQLNAGQPGSTQAVARVRDRFKHWRCLNELDHALIAKNTDQIISLRLFKQDGDVIGKSANSFDPNNLG